MAVQPILETIQKWLNKTYTGRGGFNPIAVTGEPGWDTTNAMLIAYQIENGVSIDIINKETSKGIYDFTSEGFSPLSSGTDFSIQANLNRLYILQGAFYVKGINPGGFQVPYSSTFSNAVSTLQSDAGISATGIVDILVAKALLSMDDFEVLPQYGGVAEIAEIQKALNAKYAYDMGSLIPCDGVYGRELNKALIYAFQITEGVSPADANEANGHFGLGTQAGAPTLVVGEENYFVTILQYALYCNGYIYVDLTGIYDSATESAVAKFGSAMGLETNFGAKVDLNVWMALLLTSGNPNRSVSGCDAAQKLSLADAQILKANGYNIVGRYLTGDFATSVEELTNILNAGLNVFPIYETGSYETRYFSEAQGASDAVAAVEAARAFGIPQGTRIYFTVDYDMEQGQIEDLVLPYFKALNTIFNNAQFNYNIGVYGSRNVCSQVIEAGYADLAFVDGASTGYSGNMGFNMPTMWAFNQIKEGVTVEGIQIDNDQVSGREEGFSSLVDIEGNTGVTNKTFGSNINYNISQFSEVDFDVIEKALLYPLTSVFNIKGPELLKLTKFDKKKLHLSGGPLYIANDVCYLRYESGIRPQLGSGSDLTFKFDKLTSPSVTFTNSGIGNSFSSKLLNSQSFQTKLLSLLPSVKIGDCKFFISWKGNSEAEPGYYEMALEVGVKIPTDSKEMGSDGKLKTIKSLVGDSIVFDIILGVKKDIIFRKSDMGTLYQISGDYALSLFTNTVYTLTDTANNGASVSINADNKPEISYTVSSPIIDELSKLGKEILIDGTLGIIVLLVLLRVERTGSMG